MLNVSIVIHTCFRILLLQANVVICNVSIIGCINIIIISLESRIFFPFYFYNHHNVCYCNFTTLVTAILFPES